MILSVWGRKKVQNSCMSEEKKKEKYSDKNSIFPWSILHNPEYNLVFIALPEIEESNKCSCAKNALKYSLLKWMGFLEDWLLYKNLAIQYHFIQSETRCRLSICLQQHVLSPMSGNGLVCQCFCIYEKVFCEAVI